MADSAELNRMLMGRFEEVVEYLLPNGKKKGNKWVIGGIDGSAGDSMEIMLSGPAAGRFVDHANKDDKGGTPLWLWAKAKNIPFKEAVEKAKEFLGVKDEDFGLHRHHARAFSKPDSKTSLRPLETNTPIMDYLVVERRLDPIVVSRAKITETDDGSAMVFSFAEWSDEKSQFLCVHRKFLKLDRPDGKKESWASKGTKRCLYGKNLIDDQTREIVISEGEIDALSWQSWGIPAVSIPNGVSDGDWIDLDWEWLSRFEKIYISMDMDEPGRVASLEFTKRLGLHRCYIVELPKKDANECLVAGLKREDMEKCLSSAKAIELDEIKRPDDFMDEVLDYYSTDPTLRGEDTPWTPDLPWRIRQSEFTVITGFSGHGKTAGLNQLMIHLLAKGIKIMDASLEIKPGMTLYNMTRCALGKKTSTKEEVTQCVNWLNNSMLFLDCIGTVNLERLKGAMEYAVKRHGVQLIVLDSLFKMGLSSEDYGAQRVLADWLTTFCNNTGAHVILVAHSRKTSNGNEMSPPSKSDVAGSSDITNAAFNNVVFWRNKMKKRKLDEARVVNDMETINKWIEEPDGKIILDKQRFGEGEEKEIPVWFDSESCQFHVQKYKKLPYFIAGA